MISRVGVNDEPRTNTRTIRSRDAVLTAGGQVIRVTAESAARFQLGDTLAAVPHSGELLRIPAVEKQIATAAVTRCCVNAFQAMGSVSDAQISTFYEAFACALENDELWSQIVAVNAQDVADAKARGRSTTRLLATEKLRKGMIDGLRWAGSTLSSRRGQILGTSKRAFASSWLARRWAWWPLSLKGGPMCWPMLVASCVVVTPSSFALAAMRCARRRPS